MQPIMIPSKQKVKALKTSCTVFIFFFLLSFVGDEIVHNHGNLKRVEIVERCLMQLCLQFKEKRICIHKILIHSILVMNVMSHFKNVLFNKDGICPTHCQFVKSDILEIKSIFNAFGENIKALNLINFVFFSN